MQDMRASTTQVLHDQRNWQQPRWHKSQFKLLTLLLDKITNEMVILPVKLLGGAWQMKEPSIYPVTSRVQCFVLVWTSSVCFVCSGGAHTFLSQDNISQHSHNFLSQINNSQHSHSFLSQVYNSQHKNPTKISFIY